jgi:hypothetical protein
MKFQTIPEYELYIFKMRHKKILEGMDERIAKKIALNASYGSLKQPQEDIRCDCPLCKELWS